MSEYLSDKKKKISLERSTVIISIDLKKSAVKTFIRTQASRHDPRDGLP